MQSELTPKLRASMLLIKKHVIYLWKTQQFKKRLMKKEKWFFDSKWLILYFGWHFDISYETCGYFDARHRINLDLIFFSLTIILPIYSEHTHECDPPKWGISYHNQTFWIYRGGKGNGKGGNKWWTINMPWQFDWVRTSVLLKDGGWVHETKGARKDFWKDEWKDMFLSNVVPYKYVLKSGEIQDRLATITQAEREWRWHGFKWLPFPRMVRKVIEVNFNEEVGERSGSWKGGTLGCSYELLPSETPIDCLRRMERERKF